MNIRGILSAALLVVAAFGICELVVRSILVTRLVYDVEMTRYALEAKIPSSNARIGHVHRPGAQLTLMGVPVRINADGLRDREHQVARSAGTERIAFLGDSITFGWGVREEETFKALLEKELARSRPTEIINFGTGNYNTEQEVHQFLERGLRYRPDKVVVFYFINDTEPTPEKSPLSFLGHSRLITLYWSALRHWFASPSGYRAYYSGLYQNKNPGLARARAAFLLLKEICRETHITLQVVMLPDLHQPADDPFKKEHALMMDFFHENRIEAMDLTPFFAGITDPRSLWVAPDDTHPNARAHDLIARVSLDFIRSGHTGKDAP